MNAALLGTLVVVCHPLTTPMLKSSERHSELEVIVRPYARRELLASITLEICPFFSLRKDLMVRKFT